MLQILIWAACVLIFGVGYCGQYLNELVAVQKGAKITTGRTFLVLMTTIAAALFALSIYQGQGIGDLLKR